MPDLAKKFGIKVLNPQEERFFLDMVQDTVAFREKNSYTRKDFLQLLIDLKKEDPAFSIEQIAAQSFLFFVAGFETSSSTMSFALYELALNEDLQEKARKEILEVSSRHEGDLTYEAVQEMKYLGQIVDGEFCKMRGRILREFLCLRNPEEISAWCFFDQEVH